VEAIVYLLGEPGTELRKDEVKSIVEDDFGFGMRSLETTDKKWEDLP